MWFEVDEISKSDGLNELMSLKKSGLRIDLHLNTVEDMQVIQVLLWITVEEDSRVSAALHTTPPSNL